MAGKNKVLGGGGFHHVAIHARDFDGTVDFYTRVLGFTTKITWQEAPKRAVMLDAGDGNYLEVFEAPQAKPASGDGPILHFALRTDDCDAAIERAREAGCEVTMEPQDIDIQAQGADAQAQTVPIRIGFCKGPDGELIEFFQNELI